MRIKYVAPVLVIKKHSSWKINQTFAFATFEIAHIMFKVRLMAGTDPSSVTECAQALCTVQKLLLFLSLRLFKLQQYFGAASTAHYSKRSKPFSAGVSKLII